MKMSLVFFCVCNFCFLLDETGCLYLYWVKPSFQTRYLQSVHPEGPELANFLSYDKGSEDRKPLIFAAKETCLSFDEGNVVSS